MPSRQQDKYFMKPYTPATARAEDWLVENVGKIITVQDVADGAGVGITSARNALENANHWEGYKLKRVKIRNAGEVFRLIVQWKEGD